MHPLLSARPSRRERQCDSRPDLTATDWEILLAWRDPVEGFLEIRKRDRDAIILLNLLDDLEYRTYSNVGPAVFRPLPKGGFVHARLVPIGPVPGAWLVSGAMSLYRKSAAAQVAQTALELALELPELVFRNPEKVKQGWEQMRQNRAEFVEYFGGDELVLSPAEAEEQVNAFRKQQQEDKRYANLLREYLRWETITPLPLLRLAAAHPDTVDVVFRKVLRERHCTWTEHGEALLRRRKAWYYESEPEPGFTVIGARLSELAGLARRR